MGRAIRQFNQAWIDQCDAARGIRILHGSESAFDYVVGEKLFAFAEIALTRPEFARELPCFVSEIRRMFSPEEIEALWPRIERQMAVLVDLDILRIEGKMIRAAAGTGGSMMETEQGAVLVLKRWEEKLKLASLMHELLTSVQLGTA